MEIGSVKLKRRKFKIIYS